MAVFDVDIYFCCFFFEVSVFYFFEGGVGDCVWGSFDEEIVAMVVKYVIVDDGVGAPDGFVLFEAFDDAPDFLA